MLLLPDEYVSDPCLRLLALPFAELAPVAITRMDGEPGLPEGALTLASVRLTLAATPCASPLLEDCVVRAAQRSSYDVFLLRTGLFPEVFDPVTADVALATSGDPMLLTGLILYRHGNGRLWLVPEGAGPVIAVDRTGLQLQAVPPFLTRDERSAGLCRAAAEVVRITRTAGRN